MKTIFFFLAIYSGIFLFGAIFVHAQSVVFPVDNSYDAQNRETVEANLERVSQHGRFYLEKGYVDILSLSDQALMSQAVAQLADEYENVIYPKLTSFFGDMGLAPDGSSSLTIFFHRLQAQAAGYMNPKNLYPKRVFPNSAERNIIYLNIEKVRQQNIKSFLAHELQHIISFYQKEKRLNLEDDVWLNEVRSEYAPTFLGYDDTYSSSNLEQRVRAFVERPTDSLTEWKGGRFDYGIVNMFGQYLADRFGKDIFQKIIGNNVVGIESVDAALRSVGAGASFSDVFRDFTVAVLLNDCTVEPRDVYCFKNSNLQPQNLKIQLGGVGGADIVEFVQQTKDWEGNWYEFSSSQTISQVLEITFSSQDPKASFRIPYVLKRRGLSLEVKEFTLKNQNVAAQFENFGNDIFSVVVMPIQTGKQKDFSLNDPPVSFTLSAKVRNEPVRIVQTPAVLEATEPTPEPNAQQKMLSELQEQVRLLQEQLLAAQQKPTAQKTKFQHLWNSNLFFGMRNNSDVKALQEALTIEGVYHGSFTGNFFSQTLAAVRTFQQKYGIAPANGRVGPKTRAKLNELHR